MNSLIKIIASFFTLFYLVAPFNNAYANNALSKEANFYAMIAKSQVMKSDTLLMANQAASNYVSVDRVANATPMLKFYADELNQAGVPLDFVILPLIESGNNPQAKSPVKALGLWQFMPLTGKEWGLNHFGGVDERVDVQKSTRAAAMFIKSLHKEFGDWNLVLAAYNWGPASVRKALKKGLRSPSGQIELSKLPLETRNYLISFYAFNSLIQRSHNKLPLSKYPNQSYLIRVHPSKLEDYLKSKPGLGGVSDSVLRQLNGLDQSLITHSSSLMLAPTPVFTQYFMPNRVSFATRGTHRLSISCDANSSGYKIQQGDSMETISKRFGMSVNKLVDLNPEVRFARPGILLKVC
jgi:membrane-bound lytic murein transglycosylase D